jgi:glutathione synthase/RimK-type ligase-like ATP-grasp enzyme
MDVTIIGNPENRRTILFCEAAARLVHGTITVLPYIDLLTNKVLPAITPGSIVKIDSPGENTTVRRLLTERGHGAVSDEAIEKGIITQLPEWYTGYCSLLDEIAQQLPASVQLMNTVDDIRLMFNKPACQQYLYQQQVPVPRIITGANSYASLLTAMQQQNILRVFIKPAHASSASGVVAFRKNGNKVQAVTSANIDLSSGCLQLYNCLKVRTYTDEQEVAALINTILAENAQVEEWLPKATLNVRYFDIRVLVIAGAARHTVIRTSRTVITNLHLGNERGDMQAFLDQFGERKLEEVKQLAEQTAAAFPNSLYMGVDILLTANTARPYVLEVNAFGDLLPGLTHRNENCYEAELAAALQQSKAGMIC